MRRCFLCAILGVALLALGWRLDRSPGRGPTPSDKAVLSTAASLSSLPSPQEPTPAAQIPPLTAPGLAGSITSEGIHWSAPDGRWTLAWGWAEIDGLPSTPRALREDGARWVAEHGAIQEVFEPRENGIEHILHVRVRPERFEVRIPVDASVRSWDFDGQPRITLSRPGEGDLLEVQGLAVSDARGRRLSASLRHESGMILISVEDDGAVYPVTIDPLITPPSWTADPMDQSWNEFGTSVAGAGDFNRDGFADVVVGSTRGNLDRVFLFLGSSLGPRTTASWTLPKPTTTGEGFGSRVAGAGDVNGDGFSDIVVGNPGAAVGGSAMLYLGGTAGPSSAPAWTGTGAGDARFGEALAAAGDINRDGRGDLLVGAEGVPSSRGSAYVFYGTTSGLASTAAWSVTSTEYSTRFGKSVASAGDVNGDGYLDVVVGAPEVNAQAVREGRAYLYLGTSTGLSTTPAWTADPTDQDEARFGTCVAGAGDINQDGYADVLIGAPSVAPAGRAYLYFGSPSGLAAAPAWVVESPDDPAGAYFGTVVASPGDLNGDGRRDVVISAPYADVQRSTGEYTWTVSGAVYVYLNSAAGLSSVPSMALSPTGQGETFFGRSVAAAGDTNGDSRADLIVGAPVWNREPYYGKGRAYVYFGASTRAAVPWLLSPPSETRLGTATPTLDWADCVDADGIQSYDVEVDDTSTFDAPVRWSGTVAVSQASAGPLPEGGFYWRVRARDGVGNLSDWSLVRKVYADGSGPVAPQPASPVSDAWTTTMPRLSWSTSGDFSGVANYDVEVASTPDFSGPIEFSATTQYAVDTTALGAGRHYWRVRARDTWGWTSTWTGASFVVDAVAPSAPVLVSPADGSTANLANPVFDWTDSTDANGVQGYYLYLDNEPTFANPVVWAVSVTASQVESISLTGSLYYWRVVALDRAGNGSAWSPVWSFTRSSSLPGAVGALSPANGAPRMNPVVELDWSDASDPDGIQGYQVQVSTDSTWVAPPVWTGSSSVSSITTSALPEAALSWRVRAVDTLGNLGAWSTATFRLDSTPPTAPSLVTPANGALVLAAGLMLDWTDTTDNLVTLTYDVELDSDSAFTAPLTWSGSTYPSYAYVPTFADGLYSWRVRSRDTAGNTSAWSAVRTFSVDGSPPPVPTLLSPASGATVMTGTPTLDWTDVVDPNGVNYDVQVDESATISTPLLATASGLTASQWTTPWVGDYVRMYWRVRAVDGRGLAGAWSAISSFVVDRGRGFYVGLGAGAAGLLGGCGDETAGAAWRPVYTLVDATYNAASGETRPAAGDLDGDGLPELVVGRGRTTSSGGWFAILDDQGTGFAVLRWIQLPFSAYNAANGETWPACGDIDGDGRDEIVVGLGTYTSQGGYFALYDDASTGYAFIGWRRISWSQYNAANGETRPAVGDATGDGRAEVFIGLGRYPSRGGRIARYTSGSVAFSAWMQFAYTAYNSANGETWPACGNIDDDVRDELCVGMGAYPAGGGYLQYFDDSVAGYASLGLKRIPWTEYNNAVGETRPSLGPLFGGAGDETVVGLGAWPAARGYVAVLQRAPGYALQAWKRFPLDPYNATNGATRPAVRR